MSFSEHFASKTPFKNVKEPKKPDSQEPLYSEADWHRVASVTDAAIKKGAGAYIEVSKSDKEEDKKDAAPKMSPLEAGGYEGAADVVGAATYIPTAHMYTDMFTKIGKAAMDIESNIKGKEKSDKMKKWLADPKNAGKGVDSDEYKAYYTQVYGKPPQNNNKYKENKDGTFSLIT
jgi:hypothetical protein